MTAVPDKVTMRTAGRELGLKPKEFELAVQQGEVHTVPGRRPDGPRCVTRTELERLKTSRGFPHELRERTRVMGVGEGAALLGISPARFGRLARGGCFSPARFHVNRYGMVVWLYLVPELRSFAERRPELLTGRAPEGLRALLGSGVDYRPRHWRSRRVGQLVQQAHGPWERAAARAAVLDEEALRKTVPDPGERRRLAALRPELVRVPQEAAVTRGIARELVLALDEDEALWHRLMLVADMEDVRGTRDASGAEAVGRPVPGPGRGPERAVGTGLDGWSVTDRVPVRSAPGTAEPQPAAPAPGAVRRPRFRRPGWFGGRAARSGGLPAPAARGGSAFRTGVRRLRGPYSGSAVRAAPAAHRGRVNRPAS